LRTLLVVTTVLIAVVTAFTRRGRARLKDRVLNAIEACPPIAKMPVLQQQNEDVIKLLQEQNELLRRRIRADGLSVARPA